MRWRAFNALETRPEIPFVGMAFRVVGILSILIVADAYFWHGNLMRMTMHAANGFGSDFNSEVARLLRPLH